MTSRRLVWGFSYFPAENSLSITAIFKKKLLATLCLIIQRSAKIWFFSKDFLSF